MLSLLALSACTALPGAAERAERAERLAAQAGWEPADLATDDFTLRAYLPRSSARSPTLTIYIEGDGLAWVDAATPSSDPTPSDPVALELALRDPTPSAYLARPCQYVGARQRRHCAPRYWTSHRFAAEVVRSTSQAIDQLERRFGASDLVLVGYSGGGAVAALVAARRDDVVLLVTVAGNLDPRAWAAEHRLSPLSGSLDPADDWPRLQHIPQLHLVGGRDRVVGESVARAFAARFPPALAPPVVVVPGFDHHCCWEKLWPALKDGRQGGRAD